MPGTLPHLLRLAPLGLALVAMLALAGCQTGLPDASADPQGGVTPNAVAGDAIEVTALEDPALSLDGPVEPVVADPAMSGLAEEAASDPATEAEPAPPPILQRSKPNPPPRQPRNRPRLWPAKRRAATGRGSGRCAPA